MKGTITACLAALIEEKFAPDRWKAIVEDAKVDPATASQLKLPTADIDDGIVVRLLDSTCRALGLTLEQASDAFGEYWCCTYAPKVYRRIVSGFENPRQTILALDAIHVQVTSMMKDARPPRFDYNWLDEDTLEVTYKSKRNLIAIYMGLARGVGKYFGEDLTVSKVGADRVRIEFGAKSTSEPKRVRDYPTRSGLKYDG